MFALSWLPRALALGLLAIVGCRGGSDRLDILRSDPMAGVELQDAIDVRTFEILGSLGPGKPAPAQIARTFSVPDGKVTSAIEQLADMARTAEWDLRRRSGVGYEGEKWLDGLFCQILVTGIERDGVVWVEIRTSGS